MNMYILPHIGSLYIYNYRSISTANNSYEYFLELHMAIKIIVVFLALFTQNLLIEFYKNKYFIVNQPNLSYFVAFSIYFERTLYKILLTNLN